MCIKVQGKFRYPFYGTLHWYIVEKYHQQLSQLGVQSIDRTIEKESNASLTGRWLVSVKLKKLPVGNSMSKRYDPPPYKGIPLTPPYMTPNEREGLMLLVKKMRDDFLFSGDVPPSISNPRGILECLLAQLQNPLLHTVCSSEPNGTSLLDDLKWMRGGVATDSSAVETVTNDNSVDHVTFDDDFLPVDLLTTCLGSSISSRDPVISVPVSETKPVLRVNDDHSYGQFITQSILESTHAHPLIAESPTHLLIPEYPLVAANPTHVEMSSAFPFNEVLSSSSISLLSPTLTPSLTSNTVFSPLPLSSVSPRQPETTPLTSNFMTLSSPSPSPTPVTVDAKLLRTSNLTLPEATPTHKLVKKRRRTTKEPAKPLRKVRCGQCLECMQEPCGVCKFCLDSPKYGGTGKLRKACLHRRCSNVSYLSTNSNDY